MERGGGIAFVRKVCSKAQQEGMVRQFDTAGWAYNYCIHSPAPARLDPSVPFLYPHLLELHPRSRTYDNIGREKHPRISR